MSGGVLRELAGSGSQILTGPRGAAGPSTRTGHQLGSIHPGRGVNVWLPGAIGRPEDFPGPHR